MADLSCILVGVVMTCSPLTSNTPSTTIFMQDRSSVNESIGNAYVTDRALYNKWRSTCVGVPMPAQDRVTCDSIARQFNFR